MKKQINEKTTLYLDPAIKKGVQYYALRDRRSLSAIVNEKLLEYLEDMADIIAIAERKNDPTVPFEQVVEELGLSLHEVRDTVQKKRTKGARQS